MAVLKAVVSDKDGLTHILSLKNERDRDRYTWSFNGTPMTIPPACTAEDAIVLLEREFSRDPGNCPQIIRYITPEKNASGEQTGIATRSSR